jgi:hypothetical protein
MKNQTLKSASRCYYQIAHHPDKATAVFNAVSIMQLI